MGRKKCVSLGRHTAGVKVAMWSQKDERTGTGSCAQASKQLAPKHALGLGKRLSAAARASSLRSLDQMDAVKCVCE